MVLEKLREITGAENIITDKTELMAFSYDASLETGMPGFVVFPKDADQVSMIIKVLHEHSVPYIARGSGTGYSGGSVPTHRNEAIIQLSRLNRILEINYDDEYAIVEPGVINQDLNDRLEGYRYIPDPASKGVCTIGGNVAENAGGPYCLAYGVTQNYVQEIDVVLPGGKMVTLNDNLMNLFIGSEGILGIVTRIRLKISKTPEKEQCIKIEIDSNENAAHIVSQIISSGILPAALEMVTAAVVPGVTADDKSYLLVGLEGTVSYVRFQAGKIRDIFRQYAGAIKTTDEISHGIHLERGRLYKEKIDLVQKMTGTNKRFLVDGVVPRNMLPVAISRIKKLSEKHNLPVINTFHAGDGNIHPSIFYDVAKKDATRRVERFVDDIMRLCIDLGGSLAGEHGLGLEKMRHIDMAFNECERDFFAMIKEGIDPLGLCNPGKGI